MKLSEAINRAKALTGQTKGNAIMVRWLNEMDGQLAATFYHEDFTPYSTADLTQDLLVPWPWDEAYIHYLEAMIYFSNGETERYEDARTMSEQTLREYKAYMQRTQARRCRPGFDRGD